ncbi:MAG: L,D-transpeptidase [Desulfomonilaceae bacterium]
MCKKRALIVRNIITCLGLVLSLSLVSTSVSAQMYYPGEYPYSYGQGQESPGRAAPEQYREPMANLQYDQRDAEMILRDQMNRAGQPPAQPDAGSQEQQIYDNYYGHRMHDEGQINGVVAEANNIGAMMRNKNGKPFIVVDKRNFQFYLYSHAGRLLRIGPVAIGKGRTNHGAFESPVGIFPISRKMPVDDWVRPDWYFLEEGEPIPKRDEDRRVPGFFRYKLVYDGARYIHYAEATGGRLTHGCLGLDWQDAEAVFHTLQVGSYCVIADQAFLTRLARGEFPVQKPTAKPSKPDEVGTTITAKANSDRGGAKSVSEAAVGEKVLQNLW